VSELQQVNAISPIYQNRELPAQRARAREQQGKGITGVELESSDNKC
jgi:hypothetical protein